MKTVKQIPVKKFEKNAEGSWTEGRNMTLPEDVWNRERKRENPIVRYELLATNTAPAKQLMPNANKVSTAQLGNKPGNDTSVDSEAEAGVNYENYTLPELRDACRNADIKFSNAEKELNLIAKLKKNEGSTR